MTKRQKLLHDVAERHIKNLSEIEYKDETERIIINSKISYWTGYLEGVCATSNMVKTNNCFYKIMDRVMGRAQ